jgi:carbamoyl-phosphate synthase large subunit
LIVRCAVRVTAESYDACIDARCGILLSSAGRRGALVGILRRTLADLGLEGDVVAADVSPLSAAFHLADHGVVVPPHVDPDFVEVLLATCERHAVRLLVPTHDGELPVLAAARDRFAAIGTTVSVSAPATVAIGRDKVRTSAWLVANGFPTVRQASVADVVADPAAWAWPLIVKPREGSAGIGVGRVTDPSALAGHVVHDGVDLVVQQLAPGVEHTVDVLVNRAGACVGAVPRRRLEVRAGEVSKGVTVRLPALEALARAVAEALPGAYGVLNVQVFVDGDGAMRVIEINARYGGGFPLADEAGARFTRWSLEEVLGLPSTVTDDWREGRVMLRYDDAVFVAAAAAGLG